jgi:hypothetical protein
MAREHSWYITTGARPYGLTRTRRPVKVWVTGSPVSLAGSRGSSVVPASKRRSVEVPATLSHPRPTVCNGFLDRCEGEYSTDAALCTYRALTVHLGGRMTSTMRGRSGSWKASAAGRG